MVTFLICFIILLSRTSSGAHYQYESCVSTTCGGGRPNISFPFYIPGQQESYCGYPGFDLTCKDNLTEIKLSDNDYVVDDIFYGNRSFRAYNAAVLGFEGRDCFSRIRNMSFVDDLQFGYVNSTWLHLFSGCRNPFPQELSRYNVSCGSSNDVKRWVLALYDKDHENLKMAMEKCEGNIVTPVEESYGNNGETVNNLEGLLRRGFVMNWTASGCSACEESGGRCGFNQTTYQFKCFCPDRSHSRSCKPVKSRRTTIILASSVGSFAALVSSLMILFFLIRTLRLQKGKAHIQNEIALFLKNHANLGPKRFKYSDLQNMTKSFKESLGKGGYGSVYKGKLPDGRLVAVKLLNDSKGNGEDFINEVASISRTSHINIVTLVGFCFEGSKRALVYDFMPNGSLDKFIQNPVESHKLFEIAMGIARGLEYLHTGCSMRILHFDIKPHNILLDKDFNPKISDFGLAKLCPNRSSIVSMLNARGTIGYIAPEVFCRNFGGVSHKSDVYSYGMMILEMAGGKKNIDPGEVDGSSEVYFPHYIYRQLEMDDENGISNEDDIKRKLIIVGLWCIQTDPKDRPSMSRVVEMLEGKLEILQVPPRPYMSSPERLGQNISISESM